MNVTILESMLPKYFFPFLFCFSFIGTQSVALCRKMLKIGDINFTTGKTMLTHVIMVIQ